MSGDLLHGGALDRMRTAFPDAPEPWIDLSTGINPWPYPDTSVTPASLHHLPTNAASLACRKAMTKAFGAPEESLLIAPGSEILIRLLPTVISLRKISLLSPTYGDHANVWRGAGVKIINTADPLAFADEVDAVVICNPNNPDGRTFSPDALDAARRRLAARGGWLIVDEAYCDLDPSLSVASLGGAEGLLILRSFGKFYGLAGLRLGAIIAPESLRSHIAARLGVWPASGPALEIGARAYADHAWRLSTRKHLGAASRRLDGALVAGGLTVVGGTDLFRFVEAEDAHSLWERLARAGLYVRRFDWSARHLRIGLPPDASAQDRLAAALTPSG
ncbi:MAG: threonine-phosphate decarboxylase CobD [Parvularculaceae bacterium]